MFPKNLPLGAMTALALMIGSTVAARADLVLNGGFEVTTNGPGELVSNTDAAFWSSPDYSFSPPLGYTFIFDAGTMDSFPGAPGAYGGNTLWGPGTGINNGLMLSPDGGNFIGADGDPQFRGRLEQTINGLVVNQAYKLGFWWAGAQQYGTGGATTEQWQVTFGGSTQSTAVLSNVSGGFTGWRYETMYFTAQGETDVLSFLASGTPGGAPPFVLLDGVTLTAVPEPSALLLVGVGLLGIGAVRRLRREVGPRPA